MTVKRYRDVAEMPPPPASEPGPATYARIKELWRFSSHVVRPLFAPGVYRYRSIDESHAARERATIERMRAMRKQQGR